MIEEMNRAAAKHVSDEALKALEEVAERLGLGVERGRGKFDPVVGTHELKVTFTVEGAGAREFERYAPEFGLRADHYGATLPFQGRDYVLKGLKPNRPKYPVQAEDVETGRQYKLPERALDSVR